MERQQMDRFRQLLMDEKRYWSEQVERINDSGLGQSMSEAYEEMSLYDNHPADAGSEMFEREKDLGLRSNAQRNLKRIDHALARMEEGKYGICEECGRPIDPERLQAFPSTTLCIDCKQAQERLPDQSLRPAEEKFLNPPFGRTWRDDSTFTGYDGEDAWQDVGVYGTSEGPQDVPGAIDYGEIYRSDEEPHGMTDPIDVFANQEAEPLGNRGMARAKWGVGGAVGERVDRPLTDPDNPLASGPSPGEMEDRIGQ